ncbi:hypothetical protein BC828DRAFT_412120 [Blastocladiella britannica]|nr:hypothetical protein BC828DRAFT_412120 [Blastocladiella britannica]
MPVHDASFLAVFKTPHHYSETHDHLGRPLKPGYQSPNHDMEVEPPVPVPTLSTLAPQGPQGSFLHRMAASAGTAGFGTTGGDMIATSIAHDRDITKSHLRSRYGCGLLGTSAAAMWMRHRALAMRVPVPVVARVHVLTGAAIVSGVLGLSALASTRD